MPAIRATNDIIIPASKACLSKGSEFFNSLEGGDFVGRSGSNDFTDQGPPDGEVDTGRPTDGWGYAFRSPLSK